VVNSCIPCDLRLCVWGFGECVGGEDGARKNEEVFGVVDSSTFDMQFFANMGAVMFMKIRVVSHLSNRREVGMMDRPSQVFDGLIDP
jgi:hypothetical protein